MISKPSSSAIMSKAEFAYTAIRDAIQGGELTPGQRLGPRELAENLGISYTPVREALTLLEHEGLVIRQRNKGTYVRTVSRTQIEQIYSLRLLLEPKAAAEAAQHSNHGLVVKLNDFLSSEPAREDSRAITFQNQDFHMTVYAAAENPPPAQSDPATLDRASPAEHQPAGTQRRFRLRAPRDRRGDLRGRCGPGRGCYACAHPRRVREPSPRSGRDRNDLTKRVVRRNLVR